MKHRLLFVDDDINYLTAVRGYFEAREFLVTTASSGEESLQIVLKEPEAFSVAVVDYQMKGMNGLETVVQLRKINPDLTYWYFQRWGTIQ